MWALVVVALIAVVAVASYKPPQTPVRPPSDIDPPTSTEGRRLPYLYGTRTLKKSNCAWAGDYRTEAIRKKA